MTAHLVAKPHIENCTGAQCPERSECLRYLRPAYYPRKDFNTGVWTVQKWASYDIERQHYGNCAHKVVPHGAIAQAMARAIA